MPSTLVLENSNAECVLCNIFYLKCIYIFSRFRCSASCVTEGKLLCGVTLVEPRALYLIETVDDMMSSSEVKSRP